VATGAGHPLPAQVIAGQVTIEQVAIKPIRPRAPMNFAQMHHVTGQPHACMVVHAACVIKAADGHVDGVHTGVGLSNVIWDRRAVLMVWQRAAVQRGEDGVAAVMPHMSKVGAPSQLKDKLVLRVQAVLMSHPFINFTQADEAVGDVWRQMRHRTFNGISSAGVFDRVHSFDALPCGFRGGRVAVQKWFQQAPT